MNLLSKILSFLLGKLNTSLSKRVMKEIKDSLDIDYRVKLEVCDGSGIYAEWYVKDTDEIDEVNPAMESIWEAEAKAMARYPHLSIEFLVIELENF